MNNQSELQKYRLQYEPKIPSVLKNINNLKAVIDEKQPTAFQENAQLGSLFPLSIKQKFIRFENDPNRTHLPQKVGVVLSGGQAPGGHNVISGLFDALKKMEPQSELIGFLNGPSGIIQNKHIAITEELLAEYRNQGGFDIIGSGRTKIETPEQFAAAEKTCRDLGLTALVVIGGDDSNTNAALLAEYFLAKNLPVKVVGVPKTIDGDLKNEFIEVSFGFDTASKVFSEIIGNIMRDALSAKKYYYFIKLMGRSASHITLECAFQTHPNLALISEEVLKGRKTLNRVTSEIADLICKRAEQGKDYGVILIPEGIIEFIPEFKVMIEELNRLLAPGGEVASHLESLISNKEKVEYVVEKLKGESKVCFEALPPEIKDQLLLDRDPHGNVQVSKIETERLFINLVKCELQYRKQAGKYKGKFSGQPHFCGYEGRSCMPSNFDSDYCYALGYLAALLVDNDLTGYICSVQNLTEPTENWQIAGVPIVSMMTLEERHGKAKPVIRKALVELDQVPYQEFVRQSRHWALEDQYRYPGPIQYFGPKEICDEPTFTLKLENIL